MSSIFARSVRNVFDAILDFVYPPLCFSCGELLESGREHICTSCWSSIKRVRDDPSLYDETKEKLLASGAIDDLVSLFVFEKEGAFQRIVHSLKYSGVQPLGTELGKRLGAEMLKEGVRADILVSVPLHKRRLRERGYNQSELIARGIAEVTGIAVRNELVKRSRWTSTQTALSLEERQKNVTDAFVCPVPDLEGAVIIVIDDVITTGATIASCGCALKKAGASRIIAASAALAGRGEQ
jgi:ComF family protein